MAAWADKDRLVIEPRRFFSPPKIPPPTILGAQIWSSLEGPAHLLSAAFLA